MDTVKLTVVAALSLLAVALHAVPAKQGLVLDMPQPDGTVVRLTLHGDEYRPLYLTTDSMPVIGTGRGYYYAGIDAGGHLVASSRLAHNADDRTPAEHAMLCSVDRHALLHSPAVERQPRQRVTHDRVGTFNSSYNTIGTSHSLVLLVQYADVPFTLDDPYDYFSRMLNQEGFDLWNGTGSCHDYFLDNSNGLFDITFDVYGPVTLPNERAYYGGNDDNGADMYPYHMALHAAQILDDTVDFSQYDHDGDGYVDNVFVFYAGQGESNGGGADTVWPHSMDYVLQQRFDGVRLRTYACGSEMASSWRPDGIGTFVHEFCHVLGLPDVYNVNDPGASYTPGPWTVLDGGCYNNDSRTPPCLSAFERNALGWMGDLIYEPSHGGQYTLDALSDGGEALLLPTAGDNEFFVIENRQKRSWDAYLPYHGMLVWHITYDRDAWRRNNPNKDPEHQRIDLIEACGDTYSTQSGYRRYPFPGTDGVTELRYHGTPSLEDWYGNDTGYMLTGIRESGDVIAFDLGGDAGISGITADDTSGWTLTGRHLSAAGTAVTVTDICGCEVASGACLSMDLEHPGVYLITVDGVTAKAVVK